MARPQGSGFSDFILRSFLLNVPPALRAEPAPASQPQPALREYVAKAVRRYLHDMNGADVDDLHVVVMREIETPLLHEVMRHCDGNQSRAADMLGINRATLRKKLKDYGLA